MYSSLVFKSLLWRHNNVFYMPECLILFHASRNLIPLLETKTLNLPLLILLACKVHKVSSEKYDTIFVVVKLSLCIMKVYYKVKEKT